MSDEEEVFHLGRNKGAFSKVRQSKAAAIFNAVALLPFGRGAKRQRFPICIGIYIYQRKLTSGLLWEGVDRVVQGHNRAQPRAGAADYSRLSIPTSKPWNRNPDLEVLFFPHLMLRFLPILAGV